MLSEFTLRSTSPLRRVQHRAMPWLPEARAYRQRVQVRCAGWGAVAWPRRCFAVAQQPPRPASADSPPGLPFHAQVAHRWWRVLLANVRATDLAAADAAGDTSLRACFARLPLSDELLIPQLAVYLIAGFEVGC